MGQPAKSTRPLLNTSQRDNVALWQQTQTKPLSKTKIKSPSRKPPHQSDNQTNTEEKTLLSDAQAKQFAQQHSEESDQLAKDLQGRKEDELPGYSQDEITFLNNVLRNTKIRPDNMIELPLPFKEANPKFPFNRKVALERTKNTLNRMRKREPEFFKKTLEKFAQNVDRRYPRFEPIPNAQKFNSEGHAYWIPQFSVKQKAKLE